MPKRMKKNENPKEIQSKMDFVFPRLKLTSCGLDYFFKD
jgi:hypothetical protein